MAFSTRDARRHKLSAELRDWCRTGAPEERRTVVLKLASGADLDRLAAGLDDLGATLVSIGPAVAVAEVSCGAARKAADLPGVVSADLPARLAPKDARSPKPSR